MKSELPKRKNIRIPEYDYSKNGYYFITICTYNRNKILSNIVGVGVLDDPLAKKTLCKYLPIMLTICYNYIYRDI